MKPLTYNIKDLEKKQSPAIRLKIVIQTDWINFEIYSQWPLKYDTSTKAEN